MIAAFKNGCYFSYDRNEYYSPWKVTQEFFGVYVATQFQDWADIAESALSDISVGCADLSDFDLPDTTPTSVFRDLQFSGNEDHPDYDFRSVVQEGTIIRFLNSPNKLTPPIPTSPTSDTGFLTPNPVLRWNRVRGAETNIQISTRSDFSTLVVNDTIRYERTIELEELNWATTYYWRIRSSYADGPYTNWSSVWNFTIGTATNVELDSSSLPETFSLQQNYPNPFNIGTKFQAGIPAQSTVEVKVFNLLGQQVWSLKKEKVHAGRHEFEWVPKHVSSGVYFVTATDGISRHTIKAIYLR